MLSVQDVDVLFRDFVKQTYNDSLKIAFEDALVDYRLSYNYIIEGNKKIKYNDCPIMNISNYKVFISLLTELMNKKYEYHFKDKDYMMLTDKGYLDFLMMSIVCNMQEIDFSNPVKYLERMIAAYNHTYKTGVYEVVGNFKMKSNDIEIVQFDRKNLATMESPVSRQFAMKMNNQEFILPRVHYYISGNKVFIMGIQNDRKKEMNSLGKAIDRYLRKMDKGLNDIEQSQMGQVNNIKDISVSSLASLTLFLSSMQEYKEFYMVDFMPSRYLNRLKNDVTAEEIDEIYRIQLNSTDRFLMTGARLCEHFNNMKGDFFNGIFKIEVGEYKHQEGNIIYELYESINNMKKR